jgi:hypothetical protein
MSKIRNLIQERSDIYSKYGNEILELISGNVIAAILEMLKLSDQELTKLQWTNVHVQNEHIIVAGVVKYKEGDIVADGKTKVTLDAALAAMLDKIISVAVPLELAEKGTKDDVVAHFKATAERLKKEYQAAFGYESEHSFNSMDIGPDFNYNELTEEQRKSLLLVTASQSDKGDKLN